MISMYSGTIGSGKSYHALEDIIAKLEKGFHVIANFPLMFNERQERRGLAARFMYIPDEYLLSDAGIPLLVRISKENGWLDDDREGLCLLVIDEATNYFPKEDANKKEQKNWRTFMTQTRKLGYDIILIVQDDTSINRTISKCIEYDVKHRKANNIFPFSLLNIFKITIFFYVTYWKQQRQRLRSDSTIFVKRFAAMYNTKRLFAKMDEMEFEPLADLPPVVFGNCSSTGSESEGAARRGSFGEAPDELQPEEENIEEQQQDELRAL